MKFEDTVCFGKAFLIVGAIAGINDPKSKAPMVRRYAPAAYTAIVDKIYKLENETRLKTDLPAVPRESVGRNVAEAINYPGITDYVYKNDLGFVFVTPKMVSLMTGTAQKLRAVLTNDILSAMFIAVYQSVAKSMYEEKTGKSVNKYDTSDLPAIISYDGTQCLISNYKKELKTYLQAFAQEVNVSGINKDTGEGVSSEDSVYGIYNAIIHGEALAGLVAIGEEKAYVTPAGCILYQNILRMRSSE